MIKRVLLVGVVLAVGYGMVRNLVVAPGAGLLGLLVLAALCYVAVRAWPALRGDAGRFRVRLWGKRSRGRRVGGEL